jgi:putative tricarboxylic transport membrane protein
MEASLFDVGLVLAAGVLGYGLRYFGIPQLPLVLGVVLGFMVESNYRRALVLSAGDHSIFVQDPISLGLLAAAAAVGALSLRGELGRARRERAGPR